MNSNSIRVIQLGVVIYGALILLTACGAPKPTYIVNATVSGLPLDNSVVLQDNGTDNLAFSANGTAAFHTQLATGSPYAVTVLTQPTGGSCTVTGGIGVVATANLNIAVACTSSAYSVGGSVSGLLTGGVVTLQDNGVNSTQVSINGNFTFATKIKGGSAYGVTVLTQPTGQTCTVSNGAGTVAAANITNVSVTCVPLSYKIDVTVVGLLPDAHLVLQDNGGDNLIFSGAGSFSFAIPIPNGGTFNVTIHSQPAAQTCSVSNGSGTVATAAVNVSVTCPWHVLYVANSGLSGARGSVSAFIIDPTTGALSPVIGGPFTAGSFPSFVTTDPTGRFAYVSSLNSSQVDTIFPFSINASTGRLTAVPPNPVTLSAVTGSIVVNPNDTFVYSEDGSDSVYAIDPATGALTLSSNGGAGGGTSQNNFTINPAGTITYGTGTNGTVIEFGINATTGALTSTAALAAGNSPFDVGITSNGNFAYVSDSGAGGGLSAYSINAGTGVLTPVAGSPFATGRQPEIVTIDPSGTFVYVVNYQDSTISGYAIEQASGALTPIAGSPFTASSTVQDFKIDPSGKFAYAANVNDQTISAYTVNTTTGSLSPITGSPFHVDNPGPTTIAIAAVP
jgi:6-phosphogluconolactonase (cycloisomerase 2 family)